MEKNPIKVKLSPLGTRIDYNLNDQNINYRLLTTHLLKSIQKIDSEDVKSDILLGISDYLDDEFENPRQSTQIIKGEWGK